MSLVVVTLLTLSRLPIAVAAGIYVASGRNSEAFAMLTVGLATDWLDGPLARALGVRTDIGEHILEPLCDAALLLAPCVGLVYAGTISVGHLIALIGCDLTAKVLFVGIFHRPRLLLLIEASALNGLYGLLLVYLSQAVDTLWVVSFGVFAIVAALLRRRRISSVFEAAAREGKQRDLG